MAIKQTLWSLDSKRKLPLSSLNSENELEDLIADNIDLLSDDWFVVGRQVRTRYGGIIDLLCVDGEGNPIVVELKRNMTPREVTAQALDYASWVKEIDADELAQIYQGYSKNNDFFEDAFKKRFGAGYNYDNYDADVQMVIVAIDMDGSTERIIKYLQGYGININVLFFNVYEYQGERLLSRAWMFEPKQVSELMASSHRDWNGEYYCNFKEEGIRSWEDAMKYGFVSAGGGAIYTDKLEKPEIDSRIWVYMSGKGYIGVGIVSGIAMPARETLLIIDTQEINFFDLPLAGNYSKEAPPEKEEYILPVRWVKTVSFDKGAKEEDFFVNPNIVCQPKNKKWDYTIRRLKELWRIG